MDDPRFYDGLVLVSMQGTVWRVHAPPRRRLDRRLGWYARLVAARVLALFRRPLPAWAQTATLGLITEHGDMLVRVVRDVDSAVTWVPDDVNTVPPEGLQ